MSSTLVKYLAWHLPDLFIVPWFLGVSDIGGLAGNKLKRHRSAEETNFASLTEERPTQRQRLDLKVHPIVEASSDYSSERRGQGAEENSQLTTTPDNRSFVQDNENHDHAGLESASTAVAKKGRVVDVDNETVSNVEDRPVNQFQKSEDAPRVQSDSAYEKGIFSDDGSFGQGNDDENEAGSESGLTSDSETGEVDVMHDENEGNLDDDYEEAVSTVEADDTVKKLEKVTGEYSKLQIRHQELQIRHETLSSDYKELQKDHAELQENYNNLQMKQTYGGENFQNVGETFENGFFDEDSDLPVEGEMIPSEGWGNGDRFYSRCPNTTDEHCHHNCADCGSSLLPNGQKLWHGDVFDSLNGKFRSRKDDKVKLLAISSHNPLKKELLKKQKDILDRHQGCDLSWFPGYHRRKSIPWEQSDRNFMGDANYVGHILACAATSTTLDIYDNFVKALSSDAEFQKMIEKFFSAALDGRLDYIS